MLILRYDPMRIVQVYRFDVLQWLFFSLFSFNFGHGKVCLDGVSWRFVLHGWPSKVAQERSGKMSGVGSLKLLSQVLNLGAGDGSCQGGEDETNVVLLHGKLLIESIRT